METFDISQSPFRESNTGKRFFSGAGRHETLAAIKSAIYESVPLLTLVGEEGCGKTTLCNAVKNELSDEYVTILFSQALDSFEEVTRQVIRRMNITLADGAALGDLRALLLEVSERLFERNERMLLIFDQAELIFLATLERIRKMLDIMNQMGTPFQVLFSGKKGLLENLKHLAICSFDGVGERHFTLEPLDLAETYSYLNFCMGESKIAGSAVFSLEDSQEIFAFAKGNIKKINILAEESLMSSTADTSFMVLLDNVQGSLGEKSMDECEPSLWRQTYVAHKKVIHATGAGLLAVIMLVMFQIARPPADSPQSVAPPAVQKLSSDTRDIQGRQALKPDEDEPPPAEAVEPDAKEIPPENNESSVPATMAKEPEKNQPLAAATETPAPKATPEAVSTPPVQPSQPLPPSPRVQPSQPVQPNQLAQKTSSVPVRIHDEKKIMVKSVAEQKTHVQEKVVPKEKSTDSFKVTEAGRMPVDRLFTGRVAAGAKWLIGQRNDYFTIQLMVLASQGAENSVKKMLAQKEYQGVADRLFILRRAVSSPGVMVFYGEYPTMDAARDARNALPEFLQKRNPYVISVRGAIKKASGG